MDYSHIEFEIVQSPKQTALLARLAGEAALHLLLGGEQIQWP
jgi:hypothetical protein